MRLQTKERDLQSLKYSDPFKTSVWAYRGSGWYTLADGPSAVLTTFRRENTQNLTSILRDGGGRETTVRLHSSPLDVGRSVDIFAASKVYGVARQERERGTRDFGMDHCLESF